MKIIDVACQIIYTWAKLKNKDITKVKKYEVRAQNQWLCVI
jgi:hypothetical protein